MLLFLLLPALDIPPLPSAATRRAVWLADLDPARVQPGPDLFVFVSGCMVDREDC